MRVVFNEEADVISIEDITENMIIVMENRSNNRYYILSYTDVNECSFAYLGSGQFYSSLKYTRKMSAINNMNKSDHFFYAFKTDEDFADWYRDVLIRRK